MEPEGLMLLSQVPATCASPEPNLSGIGHHIPLPGDPSYFSPICAWFLKWFLFLKIPHQNPVYHCVPKVSVLIFCLNVYWTHLKLQVISLKVWPLGSYTAVPMFFSLVVAVPEVISVSVCSSSLTNICMFSIVPKWWIFSFYFNLGKVTMLWNTTIHKLQ
jgi:hypothetical protein